VTLRRVIVRKGSYRDSITLLKISNEVSALKGVKQAAATMATPLNKRLLGDIGFADKQIQQAGPDDLVIAVEAADGRTLDAGLEKIEELLEAKGPSAQPEAVALPSSIEEAVKSFPGANLALISVPGEFAGREAQKSLDVGLNVFLFSSNVPLAKEVELKARSTKLGLLTMGPDCGTAIINGVVLGFGNVVRRGSIGLVSASGTGLQQVSTLIHQAGLGISQAIGTGGRDLSDDVEGMTTIQAMRLLANDAETKTLVVVSKPPAPNTMKKVLLEAAKLGKPVVLNFLGRRPGSIPSNCSFASTLEQAASQACAPRSQGQGQGREDVRPIAVRESSKLAPSQKYVRGLYSGGTLCYEAQVVMSPLLGKISSNAPLDDSSLLADAEKSVGHTCVDLGAEEFVEGRAHPMMDYTIRKMRIIEEAKDPSTAVILLDVVLGYGSNPDPAGQLASAIAEARSIAAKAKRSIPFVASIVGTDGDPQGLSTQASRLRKAGVVLMPSNAQASLLAALIAVRGEPKEEPAEGENSLPIKPAVASRSSEARAKSLLGSELKVINVGVGTFAEDLQSQHVDVLKVDWKPPAGGDVEIMDLLDKLR
jgi:FdrA protein